MNRTEPRLTTLPEFTLHGTGHRAHRQQDSMIRRYIPWRNRHPSAPRLRRTAEQANAG